MTTQNIYDIVVETLTQHPFTRDSDKRLIWVIYRKLGYTKQMDTVLDFQAFLDGPSFESITRARRKAQELNPVLRGLKQVTTGRASKADTKGNFIFSEEVRK